MKRDLETLNDADRFELEMSGWVERVGDDLLSRQWTAIQRIVGVLADAEEAGDPSLALAEEWTLFVAATRDDCYTLNTYIGLVEDFLLFVPRPVAEPFLMAIDSAYEAAGGRVEGREAKAEIALRLLPGGRT